MYFIRNSIDQSDEKIRRRHPIGFVDKLNKREFRGAINRYKKIEFYLRCLRLGNIDMKLAYRIGPKFFFGRLSPSTSGKRLMPCLCRHL
jgi:hypothetical protein